MRRHTLCVCAGYQVVGLDLPAHGKSSGTTTNVIDCGEAIAEVASHFGTPRGVVAHSMGANAALWALRHCGLGGERAVFLAPSVELAYAIEAFQALLALPPKAMVGLRRHIERRFGQSVWRDIRGDVLARHMQVPALIFHDPDDRQVPFEGSRRLVESWPVAELVQARGVGHGAITRDPVIIERVVWFMRDAD